MDSIHKDVQVACAWSSRRGVFSVLELLGVLVLIALIGACGTSVSTGNAQSQPGITSSGASGSAGTGNAQSQPGVTSSGASIGGDQVSPPSASVLPHSAQGYGLSSPPVATSPTPPASPACPTSESPGSESPGSESPGQACPTSTPSTSTPPAPSPTSGLASVFSYPDSPAG